MIRQLLTACLALACLLPAWAQNAEEKEHIALRQLKADIASAISKGDFDAAGKVMHQPFMATVVTQDSFTDIKGLKAYFDYLHTGATPRIKSIAIAPEADELSWLMTGTFALTRGTTAERYELADGRVFDIKGRWTAISLKEADGSWKLLGVHTGINFMDNPVINAIEKSVLWFGAAGAAIGLIAGVALGWLLKGARMRR